MASVCQIYDETTSTVLFDFNDPTAANVGDLGYSSTVLLENTNLGEPAMEFSRFSPPQRDGGSTVFQRAGFRTVTFRFRMRAAAYDSLAGALGRLSQYLNAGCVIKWQANTSSLVKFIDVEPSPSPYAMDGRELSSYLATSLVDTPDGLTLTLTCQPYLRGAELDPTVNKLLNATLLRAPNIPTAPTGWTGVAGTYTIDAATEAFQAVAAGAGNMILQDVAASVGQQWTFSAFAKRISGSGVAQVQVEWYTAGLAFISGSASTGISSSIFTRDSLTLTAPATTAWARCTLKVQTAAATVQWKNAQMELAAAASTFRVGSETTGSIDPKTNMGRVFPIVNAGNAPAPFTLTMNNTTSGPQRAMVGFLSDPAGTPGTGKLIEYLNTNGACLQFEDWTNSTDTAVDTAALSSPGTGNTGKKTTFVTASAQRATYTLTDATILSALRGKTWLVLMRVAPADATYTGTAVLEVTTPVGPTLTATATAATAAQYYDLLMGVVTFPADASWTSQAFRVLANRTAGAGNLIWDCITFVPAPGACMVDGVGQGITATDLAVSNAEDGTVIRTSAAGVLTAPTIDPRGPTPLVAPPGLSVVYSLWTEYPGVQWDVTEFRNARTEVLTFKAKHKPRYYT
jgi:hypothetical protein